MIWRWWDVRYDRVNEPRGWLRSLKLGPVIANRWHVDSRRGWSLVFVRWTLLMREQLMTRYITAAQAEHMRTQATFVYQPTADVSALLRGSGVVGAKSIDYYVVPDDDPRLANQTPDPDARA